MKQAASLKHSYEAIQEEKLELEEKLSQLQDSARQEHHSELEELVQQNNEAKAHYDNEMYRVNAQIADLQFRISQLIAEVKGAEQNLKDSGTHHQRQLQTEKDLQ